MLAPIQLKDELTLVGVKNVVRGRRQRGSREGRLAGIAIMMV